MGVNNFIVKRHVKPDWINPVQAMKSPTEAWLEVMQQMPQSKVYNDKFDYVWLHSKKTC